MDDHFLYGNNLVFKNVENSKHQHTCTHPLTVGSQTMYIYIYIYTPQIKIICDLYHGSKYLYIGHTSPDQIELYCHLHATRSTNKPVIPWVTLILTVRTWPAIRHLGKSGDRSFDPKVTTISTSI